mgnify:FL=1
MNDTNAEFFKILQEEVDKFYEERMYRPTGKRDDKKKKRRKTKCKNQPGNPWHSSGDGDTPGGFTDPDKEKGSWSRRDAPPGAACKGQTSRNTASRKQTFTKVPCGRGEKVKCHKGERKYKRDDKQSGSQSSRKLAKSILLEVEPLLELLYDSKLLEAQETVCFSKEQIESHKERILDAVWFGITNLAEDS